MKRDYKTDKLQYASNARAPRTNGFSWFLLGAIFGFFSLAFLLVYSGQVSVFHGDRDVFFSANKATNVTNPVAIAEKVVVKPGPVFNQGKVIPKYDVYDVKNQVSNEGAANNLLKDELAMEKGYYLKVAAFHGAKDAESLKKTLVQDGYTVVIKHVLINNTAWHRVFVGPFSTLRETYSSQNMLRSRNLSGILVRGNL